ncbi:hypothetical protein [Sphingomonas bacterium]|uniref:hypothetical protein n=1 Tax=Sphingomonas bacterium TaxID=1895847 RepID=UPI002601A4D1|nr:hypothetical protein [Sphingomonas bacterium]MDB5679577.1 hypothetical protein [Sphingomonas bacterium]
MKKIAFALAAAGLMSLAACHKAPPSTENTASATESDLMNNAAAMENEANAATNNAAAAAMNSATATYSNSVDSIRAEAEAAKNTH